MPDDCTPDIPLTRTQEFQALIDEFLKQRLADKIKTKKAFKPDQFVQANWLEDAARRVGQIQAVTHTLKPMHPDAKGTTIYSSPQDLPDLPVVGSHCLGDAFVVDAVGNAGALDVYKFLQLEHQGRSFMSLVLTRDQDLLAALSDDRDQAERWAAAFSGITEQRGQLASHTLAKQVYWLVGDAPRDDGSFHMLAPLYASSLAHHVYQVVQDDRFSEEAKAARQARRDGTFNERPVHEYPHLAVQKLGGSNKQNISQLNCERQGDNYLLASLPPTWRSAAAVRPLFGTDSMFYRYGSRGPVKQLVKGLLTFLKADPACNRNTRVHRDAFVHELIDDFLQFTAEMRSLPPGWSQNPKCNLGSVEKQWLDPGQGDQVPTDTPEDTPEVVSELFANWLNARLRDPLPMGDSAFLHWRKLMLEQLQGAGL